jgi:PhzF family phenazine biosynthesis protein
MSGIIFFMAKNRKSNYGGIPGIVSCQTARVFTTKGKNGNGLGVVTDARGLSREAMRETARALGFSETSFVFPPTVKGADYRVRFFTPEKEIPFAGHPALGTLFVLRKLGLVPRKGKYVQQISRRKIGLTAMPDGRIIMDQGRPRFGKPLRPALAAKMLGLDETAIAGMPVAVSTGLPHIIVPLASLAHLKNCRIERAAYERARRESGADCVMPFYAGKGSVVCRMFAPAFGITEDPATGSGCGPLACQMVKTGLTAAAKSGVVEMRITQGIEEPSTLFARVHVKNNAITKVEVGGYCALSLPRKVALD